jgi:hypothetical protein
MFWIYLFTSAHCIHSVHLLDMFENAAVFIYSTFLLCSYNYGLLQLVSTFVICIHVWNHSVYTKH